MARHCAMQEQIAELLRLTSGATNRRTDTGIPRVAMIEGPVSEHQLTAVYEPMVNLILRGSKTITVSARAFRYDPATYFVMSIDLPAVGTVHPDAEGRPYRAVSLTLEPARLAALLADLPPGGPPTAEGGMAVAAVRPELLDVWVRLLRLMERPEDIPALGPVYKPRDPLSRADRPDGLDAARDRHARHDTGADRRGDPVVARAQRRDRPDPGAGRPGGDVGLRLPSPVQGGDGAEPVAVPEAAAASVVPEIEARGGTAVALPLDVRRAPTFAAFRAAVGAALAGTFGQDSIDILVSNAGHGLYAPIEAVTEAHFDGLFDVHPKGPFFLTQALVPLMREGGRIVNLCSATSRVATAGVAPYAAFKGGLDVLTRRIAKEFGPRGIRANAVAPGPIRTDLGGAVGPRLRGVAGRPDRARPHRRGRGGRPDDAALTAPAMGWVNAQTIEIGGGYCI